MIRRPPRAKRTYTLFPDTPLLLSCEVQRRQAALKRAHLDLIYPDIKAPIDGRIGRFAFSFGDYVTPSSDPLAVIVRPDPMYFTFPVSTLERLAVRRTAAANGPDPRAVRGQPRLPDGSTHGETGTPHLVTTQLDPPPEPEIPRETPPIQLPQHT